MRTGDLREDREASIPELEQHYHAVELLRTGEDGLIDLDRNGTKIAKDEYLRGLGAFIAQRKAEAAAGAPADPTYRDDRQVSMSWSDGVLVSGLWLRKLDGRMQVLAEVDGGWRVAIDEACGEHCGTVVSAAAIREAPVDAEDDS